MSGEQHEMFLFIADISGYTAYMLKNQTDYAHGTLIVMRLIKRLIKEIELPLEISKLEGDAIFLYLPKENLSQELKNDPALLGKKLLHLFAVFSATLKEFQNSTDCPCGTCSNIQKLNLKIIGHCGKATIDKIGNFQELSGVDVILIHRLLKNSVQGNCYLLLTKPAFEAIPLLEEGNFKKIEENDKDLGKIPVYVYYPAPKESPAPLPKRSAFLLFKTHTRLFFGSLMLKLGLIKKPHFHNFPS